MRSKEYASHGCDVCLRTRLRCGQAPNMVKQLHNATYTGLLVKSGVRL